MSFEGDVDIKIKKNISNQTGIIKYIIKDNGFVLMTFSITFINKLNFYVKMKNLKDLDKLVDALELEELEERIELDCFPGKGGGSSANVWWEF